MHIYLTTENLQFAQCVYFRTRTWVWNLVFATEGRMAGNAEKLDACEDMCTEKE
jgi:hypothetical protein